MSADNSKQTTHQKRYDRQIRMWGEQGQRKLESARVALLNSGPTGSETLKNLVLGGIASFTIVDGRKVSARDLGNNFLVTADALGQPRAEVVTALLQEMNDSVAGSYVEEVPETLIESRPEFLDSFDLVVATQVGGGRLWWGWAWWVAFGGGAWAAIPVRCPTVPGPPFLQMHGADVAKLDELCRSKNVKLLVARSFGLVGYLRVSQTHDKKAMAQGEPP